MKALLLTYAFPPSAWAESSLVAKRFGNLPMDVDVLTAKPEVDWVQNDTSLEEYVLVRFGRIHYLNRRSRGPSLQAPGRFADLTGQLRVPDRFAVDTSRMVAAAKKLLQSEQYDLLFSWSQWHSIHLVAGTVIRDRRIDVPWIAHLSDPWARNPLSPRRAAVEGFVAAQQRLCLGRAALVTTAGNGLERLTRRQLGPSVEVASITHSYDPTLFPACTQSVPNPGTVIRYVGGLYRGRSALPLVRALHWLDKEGWPEGLQFEIVGDVDETSNQQLKTLPPRRRPRVLPRVPYTESLALMAESDALLSIDPPGAPDLFLASKLIDYLGADKPILALTSPSSQATKVVANVGGFSTSTEDVKGVGQAIRDVVDFVGLGGKLDQQARSVFSVRNVNASFMEKLASLNLWPAHQSRSNDA